MTPIERDRGPGPERSSAHRGPATPFDLGLVASDIDGTLLADWKPISPATVSVIDRCRRAGIPFVPVTGRPIRWLQPVAEQLPHLDTLICANGAIVYDLGRSRVLTAHIIDQTEIRGVVAAVTAEHPHAAFAFEALEGLFMQPDFPSRAPQDHEVIADIADLSTFSVVKILVSIGSRDSQALFDLIAPFTGTCHASFSDPRNGLVELAPAGITKAKTLATLCQELGVDRARVMAFGDMPNDIEMLDWAGHGVAMGNALAAVKVAADAVTRSVLEDGVAEHLNAVLDQLPEC